MLFAIDITNTYMLYSISVKTFKPQILSPTVHIYACLAQATFAGAPLPQCSLLSAASTHVGPPLAILFMIFMTIQKQSNLRSKWRLNWFSCKTSSKLNRLDLSTVAYLIPAMCMFLEDPGAVGVVYESH